jgi:uncharacterized protein with NRDE domain
MCLILFSIDRHPAHRLLLLANRDEYFNRPARPAQYWPEYPEILAGRDETGGGTWLGLNRRGRFIALTNYRDPVRQRHPAPSRGLLLLEFLRGDVQVTEFLTLLQNKDDAYNGFNLLLSDDLCTFFHYSNIRKETTRLQPGIHGLSNHLLNTPWPKVENGKKRLKEHLLKPVVRESRLFALLGDRKQAAGGSLPDTGIGLELEKRLSPIFIRSDGYGTRCSTILSVGHDGGVYLAERSYDLAGAVRSEVRYSFIHQPR